MVLLQLVGRVITAKMERTEGKKLNTPKRNTLKPRTMKGDVYKAKVREVAWEKFFRPLGMSPHTSYTYRYKMITT